MQQRFHLNCSIAPALKILNVKRGESLLFRFNPCCKCKRIKYVDANPTFIDSDSHLNMCSKSLDVFKSHLPKAVIATDIYGQSANYKE